VCDYQNGYQNEEIEYLKKNFFGIVVTELDDITTFPLDRIVYLCGDIQKAIDIIKYNDIKFTSINIIEELSTNFGELLENAKLINVGQVPLNIYGVGIYFRKYFPDNANYFNQKFSSVPIINLI